MAREAHELSLLMPAAAVAPSTPHPWDPQSKRMRPIERLLLLPILPIIVLVRIIALVFAMLLLSVTLCICKGPLEGMWNPMVSIVGRLTLFTFGVCACRVLRTLTLTSCAQKEKASALTPCLLSVFAGPGMLSESGENKCNEVPVAVVAPHIGLLDAAFFMYRSQPRPIAIEAYTKIPLVGSLFKRAGGIAVPVAAATRPPSDAKEQSSTHATPRQRRPSKEDTGAVSTAAAESTTATCAAPKGHATMERGSADHKGGAGKSASHAVRSAIQQHKALWKRDPRACPKPVLILPEGTTHNGSALLTFFSGAFDGGGPVQP